jgi:hypothetical protein
MSALRYTGSPANAVVGGQMERYRVAYTLTFGLGSTGKRSFLPSCTK